MMNGPVREEETIRHIRTALMFARELRGLTQRDMAALTGLTQGNVSRIESGATANPALGNVAAMAYALDAEIALVQQHHIPLLDLDRAEAAMLRRIVEQVMEKHPDPANANRTLRSLVKKLSETEVPE